MQHEYLITLGSVLVATCLFYLVFRKKLQMADGDTHPAGNNQSHIIIVNIIFLLVFTVSIYTLHTEALHRPLSYFLLTSVACAIIAVEIVLYSGSKAQIYSILGKIFLIALSLRGGEYFGFAGIIGIDPWVHQEIIRDLVSLGHVPQVLPFSDSVNVYLNFPLH